MPDRRRHRMFLLQFRVSKLTHFRAVNFFDKFPKAWSFIKAIRHKQQQTFGCFANSWKLRMACTFSFLVGGECGPDSRSRVLSCQVVPLVSCSKNIARHKKLLKFGGCENEVELNLGRSACFQTPANIQEMTICPLHRERLGIGWRRSIRLCSVPEQLSGHNENSKKNAERGCNLFQSKFILEATGRFVPVGSGNYIFMCFILK